MFRKGGPTNGMTGIMSGIQDRQNYQKAGYVTDYFGEEPKSAQELGYDFNFAVPTFRRGDTRSLSDIRSGYEKELLAAAGDRTGYDPLTTFLLQYGPALASQTGAGSTLGNIVAAAKEPVSTMLKEKRAEDEFLRGIRTRAAGAAIETKEAQEKQAMDIENKIEIAKADVINKGKELANKIYANKELTKFERENLLTQLAANRKLAIEKLDIQGQTQMDLLKTQIAADEAKNEFVKSEDLFGTYNSRVASDNRATYENNKLEQKAMETFGTAFKGGEEAFIGSIHGYGEAILNTKEVPAAWKKNNEGNIFYDVTDGNFKRLRKTEDGWAYEKLDMDKYSPKEENDIEGGPEKKSTSLSREDAEVIAEERGFILIGDPPPGASRNWMAQEKKRLGPNAVSIEDINKLLEKEKMESLYGSKKSRSKTR